MQSDLVIVGGARTAMAEYSGTPGFGKFKDVTALDLGAHAAKAALESDDRAHLGDVVQLRLRIAELQTSALDDPFAQRTLRALLRE